VRALLQRGLALAAVPVLVLAACGDDDGDGSAGGDEQTSVVASFYPIAEAASRVGGDLVDVTNLTPAGTEPHDMELTPDLVDELEDADLVLYLGQGFQPAVEEIAEGRDGPSIDLLEGLDLQAGGTEALEAEEAAGGGHAEEEEGGEEHAEEEEGGEEHAESELDPHFWLDPQLLSTAVDEVESALAEVAPDDASTFASNAEDYRAELATLDEEMATALGNCERDDVVTSHAAFFYLAERYGLTQLPIAGVSPEAEPDADRLDELADLIESEGITTVFFETLVSPDVAETLARETDAETAVLNPIEGLTEEQLDAGDDYASVMRENLAALQEALGCS
jgi:zinc transport system substrate-binding protein